MTRVADRDFRRFDRASGRQHRAYTQSLDEDGVNAMAADCKCKHSIAPLNPMDQPRRISLVEVDWPPPSFGSVAVFVGPDCSSFSSAEACMAASMDLAKGSEGWSAHWDC